MRVKPLLLAALLLPALGVCASERQKPTVGELSDVQSQTIMYEAEVKRAEAQAKLLDLNLQLGEEPQTGSPSSLVQVTESELPTVTGVSGAAGRLYATFRYVNGTTVSAKSGEQIPGNFRVAEVGIDRAVVTRGDRRIPLRFGVANESVPQPQTPGQMPMFNAPSPPLLR